ncbi:hypothetical protein B0T22DRAFT_512051 [Podospora appendiculata]|uniref:Ig-like domain-containing protein n=1 Tax=Podospora appendiculata TaxID=314037 RepID=A0AAE0X9S4_9PEZI|nr:hypothetical protein B0T22DRAFT_512051 [Podospora appendiculata]
MIDNVEPFAFRPLPLGKMAAAVTAMVSPPSTEEERADHHRGGAAADIPRPLQIVKRAETDDSYSYRRCSTQSNATDASMDSVPEPPGGDRPLAMPKRRDHRTNVVQSAGGGVGSGVDLFFGGVKEDSAAASLPFTRPPHRPSSVTSLCHGAPGSPFANKPSLLSHGRRNGDDTDRPGSPSRHARHRPPPQNNSNSNSNSPWLRSSKSMLHIAARSSRDLDGGASRSTGRGVYYQDSPPPTPGGVLPRPPPAPAPGPFILVPRVVVTPESKALEDGAATLWAAVQLSTQICRSDAPAPPALDYAWATGGSQGGCGGSSQTDVFQYGCLYDVSVEVLPTSSSVVIEVLDDGACANSTLYPGSRLLVVAHIRLLSGASSSSPPATAAAAAAAAPRGHARQSSDDLIEDLEYQLGSTATEYLQVRMTYRHSVFPQRGDDASRPGTASSSSSLLASRRRPTTDDGVSSIQTAMVTICRAAIKRHNALSPWSPRPAPQPNPLFEIIASHWGPDSASDVMHRILGSRSTPRKAANNLRPPGAVKSPPPVAAGAGARHAPARLTIPDPHLVTEASEETLKPSPIPAAAPTRAAPPIPKRQASLNGNRRSLSFSRRQQQQPHPLQHQETPPPPPPPPPGASSSIAEDGGDAEQDEDEDDPARRIWSEMRRASTGFRPSYLVSRVKRVPSGSVVVPAPQGPVTPTRARATTARGRDGMQRQQQREAAGGLRERALRNMRSVGGTETLRGYGAAAAAAAAAAATVGGRFGGGVEGAGARSLDNHADGHGHDGSVSAARVPTDASSYYNRGGSDREYMEQRVSGSGGSGGKAKKEKEQQSGRWGWSGWWP